MPSSASCMRPHPLDHVSVRGPALGEICRRLGLPVRPTPGTRDHARVLLDRTYLELAEGSAPEVRASRLFLGFQDASEALAALHARGLAGARLEPYRGHDGVWEDVSLGHPEAALVTLVHRVEPADLARDWPPALVQVPASGVRGLAAVTLTTPDVPHALELFRALCGESRVSAQGVVELGVGRLLIEEGPERNIRRLVLATADLEHTRRFLAEQGLSVDGALRIHGLPGPLEWALFPAS